MIIRFLIYDFLICLLFSITHFNVLSVFKITWNILSNCCLLLGLWLLFEFDAFKKRWHILSKTKFSLTQQVIFIILCNLKFINIFWSFLRFKSLSSHSFNGWWTKRRKYIFKRIISTLERDYHIILFELLHFVVNLHLPRKLFQKSFSSKYLTLFSKILKVLLRFLTLFYALWCFHLIYKLKYYIKSNYFRSINFIVERIIKFTIKFNLFFNNFPLNKLFQNIVKFNIL